MKLTVEQFMTQTQMLGLSNREILEMPLEGQV